MAHAHAAQDSQREFRPDPAHIIDQQPKQIALGRSHEAVKNMRVFADGEMCQNADRLTDCRQFIVARERDENFVADAVNIDSRLRRKSRHEFAIEESDHLRA